MPCGKNTRVGWLDKVKFIRHLSVMTCTEPWYVYAETGLNALTNLAVGFIDVSPRAFTYFMLKPKGARSIRHGRSKGRKGKVIGEADVEDPEFEYPEEGLPDTAELFANTIKGTTGFTPPVYSAAGDILWAVARPVVAAGFSILLANLVTDFAYDWWSGIILNPSSNCDTGRFDIGCPAGTLIGHDSARGIPSGTAFPPVHCSFDISGVHLLDGTWVVIPRGQVETSIHPEAHGVARFHIMLGITDNVRCGPVFDLRVDTDSITPQWHFVLKVEGPETINIHIEWIPDDTFGTAGFALTEIVGFLL